MRARRAPLSSRTRASAACLLVTLFNACGELDDRKRPTDVVAEVCESIATVVNLRWNTAQPSIGYIQYGPTQELDFNTPLEAEPSQQHALSLLGLTADTVYYYRVVTWDGDDAATSEVNSIRTGDLPVGMPPLTQTGEGHHELTVVPILGAKTAITIIDPLGKIVWYHTDARDLDFYRARLSVDGKSLLYNAARVSGAPSENSELVRVRLDGSHTSSIPVPFLAHDFLEHTDGTLAAIAVEYRDFEGTPLRGDKIVEIDKDGGVKTVWSAWDCFDPALVRGDNPEQGWTFANALDYDPAADAYYLGMRNFSSITKINRKSGACEWVLGLGAPTLRFAPGAERFLHQHQFQVRGNRILVMDNDGSPGNESRVLEYELDLENNLVTQVWSYVASPSVYTFVLGEPTRLDDGGTFINWSAAGQLERLDAAGKSVWKLNTGAGFVFGFHTLARSLYPADATIP